MSLLTFLKKAFGDMKKSAQSQHEADKANLRAVKAESRASFEENRGRNTLKRAKAEAKRSWDDAHLSPSEREAKMEEARRLQIAEAEARIKAADERYEAAKK